MQGHSVVDGIGAHGGQVVVGVGSRWVYIGHEVRGSAVAFE